MALDSIQVFLADTSGFIWSIEHANYLRSKQRIIGHFNSHLINDNQVKKKKKISDKRVFVSLPFVLHKLEIRLCYELGLACLLHAPKADMLCSNPIINEFCEQSNVKRIDALEQSCALVMREQRLDETKVGQKRKLCETDIVEDNQTVFHSANKATHTKYNTHGLVNELCKNPELLRKRLNVAPVQQDYITWPKQMFDSHHLGDHQGKQQPRTFWSTLFQFTKEQQYNLFEEQYTVFRDLYDRGFYVLIDARYSGDFILYRNSPLLSTFDRIHADYIVSIVSKSDIHYNHLLDVLNEYAKGNSKLLELDILLMSRVRVAVHVKKKMMFAFVHSDCTAVNYFLVQWNYCTVNKSFENDTWMNLEKDMWYEVYNNYQPVIDEVSSLTL